MILYILKIKSDLPLTLSHIVGVYSDKEKAKLDIENNVIYHDVVIIKSIITIDKDKYYIEEYELI